MAGLLEGRVALVTGAGSGIGRAIALAMAKEGATIAAVDRVTDAAAETVGMIGGGARAFRCDIAERAECDALAGEVTGALGAIDILVNNAAIIRRASADEDEARDVWDAVMHVNLNGAYNMITACRAALIEAKGAVVNMASTHAFVAAPKTTAYTVSKAGIHGLTFSMAAELGPHGVRVNAVAPGYTETPMNEGAKSVGFDFQARFGPRTPLGRPAQAEDIALPVVFLASDMARYVTGVTLRVDGGYLCH